MWEYEEVAVPLGAEKVVLETLGKDEWELVGMYRVPMAPSPALQHQQTEGWLLVFKRPYDKNRLQRNGVLSHAGRVPKED